MSKARMSRAEKRRWVLHYFNTHQGVIMWVSPTTLGVYLGAEYETASAKASPICKELVSEGILERNSLGHYRLKQPSEVCDEGVPTGAKRKVREGSVLSIGERIEIGKYLYRVVEKSGSQVILERLGKVPQLMGGKPRGVKNGTRK